MLFDVLVQLSIESLPAFPCIFGSRGTGRYVTLAIFHERRLVTPRALEVKELILEPLTHVADRTFRVQLKAILSTMPSLMQQMAETGKKKILAIDFITHIDHSYINSKKASRLSPFCASE